MISTDGAFGLCGKGKAAESTTAARVFVLGRDEKIGATVTDVGVALLDILTSVTVLNGAVLFYFVSQKIHI